MGRGWQGGVGVAREGGRSKTDSLGRLGVADDVRADEAGPAGGGREMADWAAGVKGGGTVRRKKRGTKHWVIFS